MLVVFVDDEGEKGNELKRAMCTELSSIFKLNLRSNHCSASVIEAKSNNNQVGEPSKCCQW